jgi:HEAT repeat protein
MRESGDANATLRELFDAERLARRAHDALVSAPLANVLPAVERETRAALAGAGLDDEESALRLVRLAGLLGEMQGARVVDLLVDILECDEPEARHSAGESLSGLAFERFKEVALGVERALVRLASGSPALAELPYILAEVPEPGVHKLLAAFLAHPDPDAVASAIEVLVEMGDASVLPMFEPLARDSRKVQLEDEGGTEGEATIAELVAEARQILGEPSQ